MQFTIKIKNKSIDAFIVVFIMVLCCSTTYFTRFHAAPTYISLLFSSVLLYYRGKIILKKNCFICALLVILVGIISIFNFDSSLFNNVIIFIITLVVLLIVSSNISKNQYQKYFIYIMFFETLLSLLCFVVCYAGYETVLPGYQVETLDYSFQGNEGYNNIYFTPYYTVGWLSTGGFFFRNAGVFSEPGVHAIMQNIALLFILNGGLSEVIKRSHRKLITLVLIVGVVSTKSTAGYLSLILIGVLFLVRSKKINDIKKRVPVFMVLLAFSVVEVLLGDTFDKLINRSGSFMTRSNDTIGGLELALESPFVGFGYFASTSSQLEKYGIRTMSNGLVGLIISVGIPFTILYLIFLYKGVKQFFGFDGFALWVLCLFVLLNMNTQPICWYIVFLSLMFYWKEYP